MRLSGFIIALLFVVAAGLVTFSFVGSLYSSDGYDIDLDDDEDTKEIAKFITEFSEAKTDLQSVGDSVFNQSAGEPGAVINSGEISEGDLIAAAGRAITNIPNYLTSFFKILNSFFSSVGLGNSPILWFIIVATVITIALLTLGVFVKQQL